MKVIGVLAPKGANMMGWDQDDVLMLPWTTAKFRLSGSSLGNVNQSAAAAASSLTQVNTLNNLYPSSSLAVLPAASPLKANQPQIVRFPSIDRIYVSARSAEEIPTAIRQITSVLRDRHRLTPKEESDFEVRDMTEFTKALTSTSTLMTNLLLCVALISLVVGGVGIMNIMLVSVTERTREIGLRMAVGARGRDILRQFLIEAILLCLFGGFAGIVFGRGSSMPGQRVSALARFNFNPRHHRRRLRQRQHRNSLRLLPRLESQPVGSHRSAKVRVAYSPTGSIVGYT